MAATDLQPPSADPNDEITKRFTGGPAAVSSAACGVVAMLFALQPRGEVIAAGFSIAAVILAIRVLLQVRRDRRPGRELALAGIALAFLATVGTFAAQAAFSTITERDVVAEAPVVALGVSASTDTKDVLEKLLNVDIHGWRLSLDESGISSSALSITVTNKSKSTRSFDLKLEALHEGKLLTTDSAYIPNLKAGQSANVSVFNIVSTTLAPELEKADVRITEAFAY